MTRRLRRTYGILFLRFHDVEIDVNVPEDARENINTGARHLVIDTKAKRQYQEIIFCFVCGVSVWVFVSVFNFPLKRAHGFLRPLTTLRSKGKK